MNLPTKFHRNRHCINGALDRTDKHIDGNTDNKGRKKKKNFENFFFLSTKSTTQQISKKKFFEKKNFFDWIDYPTNISTEILIIRVEQISKNFFLNFFD